MVTTEWYFRGSYTAQRRCRVWLLHEGTWFVTLIKDAQGSIAVWNDDW
jgi:hypothetical protein